MKPRSAALPLADRDRIAKLLGMTGSRHDGEALNAARMADALVRELGLTWTDVLAAVPPADPGIRPQPAPQLDLLRDWPVRWQSAARFCAACGVGIIRDKDIDFAAKVASYSHRPSEAQLIWLHDLTARVLAGGAP